MICPSLIAVDVASTKEDPKLIIRVINLELVQPICSRYINVTDRRTDGRTTYDSNTVHRAVKTVGVQPDKSM